MGTIQELNIFLMKKCISILHDVIRHERRRIPTRNRKKNKCCVCVLLQIMIAFNLTIPTLGPIISQIYLLYGFSMIIKFNRIIFVVLILRSATEQQQQQTKRKGWLNGEELLCGMLLLMEMLKW